MKYIIRTQSGTEIHIDEQFSIWREDVGFGSEKGPASGTLKSVDTKAEIIMYDDLGLASITQVQPKKPVYT